MTTLPPQLEPIRQWAKSRQFSDDGEIMQLVDGWGMRKESIRDGRFCEMWIGYGSKQNGDRLLRPSIQVSGFRLVESKTELDIKTTIPRASLKNIEAIVFAIYSAVFEGS